MKKKLAIFLSICFVTLFLAANSIAATEQEKQAAIDAGLAYLASTMSGSGSEGYWSHSNDGTLAATASAALAFVEEEYLPDDGSIYEDTVERALNYIFNRAQSAYAGIFFWPGHINRSVYTTGIVAPVIFALGNALGPDEVIGRGTFPGLTYRQLMQEVVDWFSWGQNYDGGWRYYPNYGGSDNSTAQWGGLPVLYAQAWGLIIQDLTNSSWDVLAELEKWVNFIQNPTTGGSGYTTPYNYVNMSKTGGLLVQLAAIGAPESDVRVQRALAFLNSRWNNYPSSTWYGNLLHPYAMWAVYKGLELYGKLEYFGTDPDERFFIGTGMPAAPGGFQIGQDSWVPAEYSLPGDWYSHYCQVLVNNQNSDGSWNGYSYWQTPLATAWYINILNAVPVVNQPPTADPNGPYTGFEGSPVSFDGTGSTDPENDPLTYEWNFGDGSPPVAGATPTHIYADLGTYTVCLTVTDSGGLSDTQCTTALITNVCPTVGPIPVDPASALVEINVDISASADFTDPGTADTHDAEWDWGDQTTSTGTVNETNGSGTVGGDSHSYSTPGVYTIQLTVTDDDGCSNTNIFQYVVVYDPNDGFVTGGGWIDSPAGAYVPDDSLTGKATFGFVSKYKKGASTPTGNTEFQFHAGDLNFHSDSYQWLVIAGARAMYKGVGTINGEGNYGFMLSAVDAKLTPSTDVDLFRIKIWDIENGDAVVYDNGLGDADDADPTTEIQGGNIVIHKK